MPNSFAETDDGLLLVASGMDPVLRWDGLAKQMVEAGLTPPAAALTLGSSGSSGTLVGTYTAYVRFVDDRNNVSNLSPLSNSIAVAKATAFVYTNVPTPPTTKAVRRQILRNTDGQAQTYYVAIDTTDLASTTLTESLDDTTLSAQLAVPLLDAEGNILADTNDPPPSHKCVLASQLGRMFLAVEKDYTQGSLRLTYGSAAVNGVGTEWTASLANRYLYVVGAQSSYQIASVDTTNQILTLTTPYLEGTDNFGVYAIRPAPAEHKLVYYSEAGSPESWPPTNAISVPEDSDDLTALMVNRSFLYLVERRHIYRFTFQKNPGTDGFNFLSCLRGCVNHRCWVVVEGLAYMLDEQGIHAFDGGDSESISSTVQELFRFGDAPLRVNWQASEWFHAVHFPQQEVIRWFVALAGLDLPYHAIAYNYRQKRWWLEEYNVPIGASCTGLLAGQPQVYLGADNRRVLALWQGTLDGPDPATGTVRGTVGTSTPDTFTDPQAGFPAAGVVGNPVWIVDGTGKGQVRIVRACTGTQIKVGYPFSPRPDGTSVYQLGGVQWRYQTGWYRFTTPGVETMVERRIAAVFQPCAQPATMTLQLYVDFQASPYAWEAAVESAAGNGVSSTVGSGDRVFDLTRSYGFASLRFPGQREFFADGPRFMAVHLVGWTNADAQKLYALQIDGVGRERV